MDMDLNITHIGQLRESVLTEILVRWREETITDEQVHRVLDPVLKMICEGRFESTHTTYKQRMRLV